MTTRRHLLFLLGAATIAPPTVFAQLKRHPVLVGWLHPSARQQNGHYLAAFRDGMTALGWKEGATYAMEERWAEGRMDQLESLAQSLASKHPAVIVAGGTSRVTKAVSQAAPKTPIVSNAGGDPVAAGFAASLARPGGLITGITSALDEVVEKYLELLLETIPGLRRVGCLYDSPGPGTVERVNRSAKRLGVETKFAEAARPEDIESAVSRLAKERVQALIVMPSGLFPSERNRIVGLAVAQRWPVFGGQREYVEAGALLSYGTDRAAGYFRVAYYVDRILKGTRPGDLPFELPTKFELIVNMKTAKALGLTIPQSILVRADRVIE